VWQGFVCCHVVIPFSVVFFLKRPYISNCSTYYFFIETLRGEGRAIYLVSLISQKSIFKRGEYNDPFEEQWDLFTGLRFAHAPSFFYPRGFF